MSILARTVGFFQSEAKLAFKILAGGGIFALLSILPLLVYIAIGPADGNPIGLGLLAMLGFGVLHLCLFVGGLMLAIEYLRGPRRESGSAG